MIRKILLCAAVIAAGLSGCGGAGNNEAETDGDPLSSLVDIGDERSFFHQIDIELSSPLTSGRADIYVFIGGSVQALESRHFDNPNPSLHIGYNAPQSIPDSAVLIHVVTAGLTAHSPQEFVCVAFVDHRTTRHHQEISCDIATTAAYYLAATQIGRSDRHPFHDIGARLPLWRALLESRGNDVNGFYVSVFGTLQNALVGLGESRFEPTRHSVRPVMETIVTRFVDLYQRQGSARASDLIRIANEVTDESMPLERLIRFQTIFDQYAYIADVELTNTGGSLTRRSRELELLTMSSELTRFFLRDSAFEMSDFRTHIVQNVRHVETDEGVRVTWDPISHMYGYNLYFNGEHVGYTRVPGLLLPPASTGTVTIKAVGYAGEFDGVHHDLAEPTLVAGASNEFE